MLYMIPFKVLTSIGIYQILGESLIHSHNECFPTRFVKFNRKRHKISHRYFFYMAYYDIYAY